MRNKFEQGKKLIGYIFTGVVICTIAALLLTAEGTYERAALVGVSFLGIVTVFYVIFKYCRCPHCNKAIILGVLQATTCPKCKRSLTSGQKVKGKGKK